MDNQLNEGQLLISRVKLLMGYDMSKTLNENVQTILEQPDSRFDTQTTKDIIKKGEEQLKQRQAQEESNKYPNWCKYPDKTLPYPKNPEGAEGDDAILKTTGGTRFCLYQSPSRTQEGKIESIPIPENSEIVFWSIPEISRFVDLLTKKYPKTDKELTISNLSAILPVDTVQGFYVGDDYYSSYITRKSDTNIWKFGYYRNSKTKKPYTPPEWVDERSDYQRFVDDYGFAIQIAAALGTAIAGMLTGGAAWVLYAEILIEGGLGLAVGLRDLEKGDNVSSALSFITGFLPMLKLSKVFRGIPNGVFTELSEKLSKAGLTDSSNVNDYVKFYNGLSEPEKMVMSKLLSQDEITRNALLKELKTTISNDLPKLIIKEFRDMIKKNPELLKDIKFFEKLWVRELSTNLSVGVIALLTELGFGDQLNNKDEKLDGVYQKIPKSLQKELSYNLLNNPKFAGKIVDNVSEKVNKQYLDELTHSDIKDSVESTGGNYTEIK